MDRVRTPEGKQVRLLNLPYFLGGDIGSHVDLFLGV